MPVGYIAFLVLLIAAVAIGVQIWRGQSPDRREKPWRGIVLVIFVISLILVITGILALVRDAATAGWPSVQGTVISSGVVGERAFHPEIVYSYLVDSQEYSGSSGLDMPGFGGKRNRLEAAETIISQYPVGSTVTVYYDPDNPARSELKVGLTYNSCLQTGAGVVLFIIAAVMYRWSGRWQKNRLLGGCIPLLQIGR